MCDSNSMLPCRCQRTFCPNETFNGAAEKNLGLSRSGPTRITAEVLQRQSRIAGMRMVREMVDHQREVVAGLVLGLNGKAGQMRADGAFAALETTIANIDMMISKEEQEP